MVKSLDGQRRDVNDNSKAEKHKLGDIQIVSDCSKEFNLLMQKFKYSTSDLANDTVIDAEKTNLELIEAKDQDKDVFLKIENEAENKRKELQKMQNENKKNNLVYGSFKEKLKGKKINTKGVDSIINNINEDTNKINKLENDSDQNSRNNKSELANKENILKQQTQEKYQKTNAAAENTSFNTTEQYTSGGNRN